MAYPFLPVNPSCGTVVVNDVCGCSSVVTNSGCNNNDPCSTTITASSTIVYNGPPVLLCIIAEPCDTLNVILQKIDEIICNLLNQINALNNQVANITNQIININNEIVDINNTLGECCTTTTSTSSTSTTTTSSSTSTSTSTSTSSSTTTTTTTCNNPNLIVNGTFDTNLNGWSQTVFNDWVWSAGRANYVEGEEQGILYQDILTPGVTYDITFDLWMNNPTCTELLFFYINVYAGDTVYGPFNIVGNQTINLILQCTNTPMFGIQAYDSCNLIVDTIFIDNVIVNEHCPQFTTTTTTTTITL